MANPLLVTASPVTAVQHRGRRVGQSTDLEHIPLEHEPSKRTGGLHQGVKGFLIRKTDPDPPHHAPEREWGWPSLYHDRYFRGLAKFSGGEISEVSKRVRRVAEGGRQLPTSGYGYGGGGWVAVSPLIGRL